MGTAGRLGTAAAGGADGDKRPMTAVKAAGFQSSRASGNFDPMQQARSNVPNADKPAEESPEEVIKGMEKKAHALLEDSAMALEAGDSQKAIDKAKEAGMHDRQLCKQREQLLGPDQNNYDLTYAILVHLATVYERCGLDAEAITAYSTIIKNKLFEKSGRLRVNLGNIYFRQRHFLKAVKQYRMALDQIPAAFQDLRNKVLRNIGHSFFCMGQYGDAATSYEHLLDQAPIRELGGQEVKLPGKDFAAGFNLMLCYFALGDRDKMRKGFQRLVALRAASLDDDERYLNLQNDAQIQMTLDAIKGDTLRVREREERQHADRHIILAAKLISQTIESSYSAGCDWCIEIILPSTHAHLAAELEISKAIMYLRSKDFTRAAEILKTFEKKESKLLSTAAANLSFLYFLEGQYPAADKYAEIASNEDRYNACALVNKGNCLFMNGEYAKAADCFKDAMDVEASCPEAIYNLGLTFKKQQLFEDALDCFLKLHAFLRHNSEVIFQIANLYERLDDVTQACEWYGSLLSLVPNDAGIYSILGSLFEKDNDKSQAFQNFAESYRLNPSSLDTISWMGAYYVESQFCEKAIEYFQRAAVVQPSDVKWRLMVASCYRRVGNYQQAMDTYKAIHNQFPENIECLRFLVRLCTDMGLSEVQEYAARLKKAEKARESKDKRDTSARSGSGHRGSGRVRATRTNSGASHAREGSAVSESRDDSAVRRSRDVSASMDHTLRSAIDRDPLNETTKLNQPPPDASYSDPIGALPQRPKTAARAREEEEWNEDIGDDLLPE